MTKVERRKPDILNASRKRRIARGAGVEVMELNRLLKQHRQMADAFKMMSRGGGKNMAAMAQALGVGGGATAGLPKGFTPPGGMMGALKGSPLGGPGGGVNMDMLKSLGGGKLPESLGEETEMPAGLADLMKGLGGPGGLPPGLGLPGFGPKKK